MFATVCILVHLLGMDFLHIGWLGLYLDCHMELYGLHCGKPLVSSLLFDMVKVRVEIKQRQAGCAQVAHIVDGMILTVPKVLTPKYILALDIF